MRGSWRTANGDCAMITVDADSVQLIVDVDGSRPGAQLIRTNNGGLLAFLHLTRNKDAVLRGRTSRDAAAIVITATVDVHRDLHDRLDGWKFRFIQVARTKVYQWVYAGRLKTEGSSMMNLAVPPNMPKDLAYHFLLDSEQPSMPFTSTDEPSLSEGARGRSREKVNVRAETIDHPFSLIPIRLPNSTTNADNLLVRAIRDIDLVTAFVAVNERGIIQVLAHVAWRANWRAFIDWRRDIGTPFVTNSKLTVDDWLKGAPAEPEAAALIANPPRDSDKCYNKVFDTARETIGRLGLNAASFASDESDRWPPGTVEGPIIPHI